ncbi:MAG: 4-(cytidine 5'-diphospho)-2-C-methyl-D-erythritol kinase [Acholeplasmatales bacterium]|jgi:4-diphosphocytidyl-2-C-methyl-D-erythritol kinase|nr:4-(cytidine 5'-diphospho)-2-C-methyl-D-erythritol kinase [Acholeplasmatales bacterium]
MEKITQLAPAKLNLSLYVTGKQDNYHLLEMINIVLPFYDIIEIQKNTEDVLESSLDIPNNIVLKALQLWRDFTKIPHKVRIILTKNIPLGAGLGGESADAAAMIRGLNNLFEINTPLEQFIPLAQKLGSDVAFCLFNRWAKVSHLGEELLFLTPNPKIKKILLILPNLACSTSEVFKHYPDTFEFNPNLLLNYHYHYKQFIKDLHNSLTATTVQLYPDLTALSQIPMVHMSGSGSCFFIINPTQKNYNSLKKISYRTMLLTL